MLTWQHVKNVGVLLKHATSTYLIPALYPKNPILIQDIEFTSRQWDIISAFYHLKKPQLIGSLLGIGSKGVEAHIYNIKQKLPFKRKDLALFLDTCAFPIREKIQKHYRHLLVEKAFQEMLKTLRSKTGSQKLTYQWNQDKDPPQDFPFYYINNHFALAGITLSTKDHKPTFILDYQTEFSDPTVYYKSFIKLLEGELQQDKIKDILQDFLKQQEDIFSGSSISSYKQPLTQNNSEASKGSIHKWVKIFLVAPEYNIHRYVGGVILSLLITLLVGFLLPSTSTTIKSQIGDGNIEIANGKDIKAEAHIHKHNDQHVHHHHYQKFERRKNINLASPWNIPYIPEHLVKREKLKDKIISKLQRKSQGLNIIGLYGLAGIGKTYLALGMINNPPKQYKFRGWITSTDEEKLKADYLKLGSDLHLYAEDMEEEQKISMIKNWLNSQENLLLVFDNAPNMEIVKRYLPTKGDILITSRNFRLPQGIEIDVMEEEEAFKLLISLIKDTYPSDQIKSLLQKLGYLPLAIAQAGAYIDKNKISIDQYLQLYDKEKAMLLATHDMPIGDSHLPAYITWSVTLKEIKEKDKTGKAIQLLDFLSFCHFVDIPRSFVKEYLYNSQNYSFFEKIRNLCLSFLEKNNNFSATQLDIQFNEIITLLRQHSLIKVTSKDTIAIHHLIQDWLRLNINLGDKKTILKKAIKTIEIIYPLRNKDRSADELVKALLPQMESIFQHGKKYLRSIELVHVIRCIADAYNESGDYCKAKQLLEEALKIQDRYNAYNDINKASLLAELGRVYLWIGAYHRGESILEKALVIQKNYYDSPNHIDIAFTLVELGRSQLWLGKFDKANASFKEALAIQENYYNPHEHIDISFTQRWLGISQAWLGNYKDSKKLLERALIFQETFYKTRNHVEVSFTIRHLGRIQLYLKNYNESKKLLEEALAIQENYYGNRENIDTSFILIDFGKIYLDLKNYNKGKNFIEEGLAIQENYYNKNYKQAFLSNDKSSYEEKYTQALSGGSNIVAISGVIKFLDRTHYMNNDDGKHINIVNTIRDLGIVYLRLNDYLRARTLLEKALEAQKRYYGGEGLEVANTFIALAELEHVNNSDEKALSLVTQSLQILFNYPDLNREHKCIANAKHLERLILETQKKSSVSALC